MLRDRPDVFGAVASTATRWRVLDAVDDDALAAVRHARALAREWAWLLRAEAGRVTSRRPPPVGVTGPV